MSKATNAAIDSTYHVTNIVHRCEYIFASFPSDVGIHGMWVQWWDDDNCKWGGGRFKWENDAKFCPQCGIELMTGPLPVKWNHDDTLPF